MPDDKKPFSRKFKEGPFKGLCFRMRAHPEDSAGKVILEFYNGQVETVKRTDYNSWAEQDCLP